MAIVVLLWAVRLTANWVYAFPGLHHEDWRYPMSASGRPPRVARRPGRDPRDPDAPGVPRHGAGVRRRRPRPARTSAGSTRSRSSSVSARSRWRPSPTSRCAASSRPRAGARPWTAVCGRGRDTRTTSASSASGSPLALFGVAAAPGTGGGWSSVRWHLAMFLGASIPMMEDRSLARRPQYRTWSTASRGSFPAHRVEAFAPSERGSGNTRTAREVEPSTLNYGARMPTTRLPRSLPRRPGRAAGHGGADRAGRGGPGRRRRRAGAGGDGTACWSPRGSRTATPRTAWSRPSRRSAASAAAPRGRAQGRRPGPHRHRRHRPRRGAVGRGRAGRRRVPTDEAPRARRGVQAAGGRDPAAPRGLAGRRHGQPDDDPAALADMAGYAPYLSDDRKRELLETPDVERAARLLIAWTRDHLAETEVNDKIGEDVREGMEKSQREFLLRQQLAAIRKELGEDDADGVDDYRARVEAADLPDDVREAAAARGRQAGARRATRAPRPAGSAPGWTPCSTCPGRCAPTTTPTSPRPARSSTPTTTASTRSRTGSSSTSPSAPAAPSAACRSSAAAAPARSSCWPALPASARPRSASRWPAPSAASSSASPSAASATRPRSAATAARTSARCPAGSSGRSRRPAR